MAKTNENIKKILKTEINYPPRPADCNAYEAGTILDKFLVIGDKPGGIEPGALVVFIDDAINFSLDCYKSKTPAEINDAINNDPEFARTVAKSIYQKFKHPKPNNELPVFLIKQDYPEASKVAPPKNRLENTNAISSLPRKLQRPATSLFHQVRRTSPDEENLNALLEVSGNSVAKNYGMPSQDQYILASTYTDGRAKIMTLSKWQYGLIPIDKCLSGSKKRTDYNNYIVKVERDSNGKPIKNMMGKNKFTKNDEGLYSVDDSFTNLSADFAIAIFMGDRDYFGSVSQNKIGISIDGKMFLYGFDFGHAFRENPYIDLIDESFHLKDVHKASSFKNMSIFFDSPMSEKMLGVFLIYKGLSPQTKNNIFSANEQHKIDEVIETYKAKYPNFAARIDKVRPDVISRSFDENITFCEEKSNDTNMSIDIRQQYFSYRNKLKNSRLIALNNEARLMRKFTHKMMISATEVDFFENLNKYCGNSLTRLSSDHKVQLKHTTYSPKNTLYLNWTLQPPSDDKVTITTDCDQNIPQAMLDKLDIMKNLCGLSENTTVEKNGKHLKITMPPSDYLLLKQLFTEDMMMACRKDYRAIRDAQSKPKSKIDGLHVKNGPK